MKLYGATLNEFDVGDYQKIILFKRYFDRLVRFYRCESFGWRRDKINTNLINFLIVVDHQFWCLVQMDEKKWKRERERKFLLENKMKITNNEITLFSVFVLANELKSTALCAANNWTGIFRRSFCFEFPFHFCTIRIINQLRASIRKSFFFFIRSFVRCCIAPN